MRRNRCLGYGVPFAIWLLSCSRTELESAELPSDAGAASIAGNGSSLGGSGVGFGGSHASNGGAFSAGNGGVSNGGGTGGAEALAGAGGVAGQMDGPTLYVDPLIGDDQQPGTRTEPLRTIARAAALARVGWQIVLLDGVYDRSNQPQFASLIDSACGIDSGVVIPSDVTLRADHPGQVRLSIAGYHGLCSSGGRIEGLRLERAAPGPRVLECDRGDLTIQESTFSNSGFLDSASSASADPDLSSALLLSGSAQVTLIPGTLADYSIGSNESLATLTEQAALTIDGGQLTLTEDPPDSADGFSRGFHVADSASLTLHGVRLQRKAASATFSGAGIELTDSGQVRLDRGASVSGFARGIAGFRGASQVTCDDVDFADNDFGVFLLSPGDLQQKSLSISGSRFTNQRFGAYVYSVNVALEIRDSVFTGHHSGSSAGDGVALEFAASGSASLDNVSLTNNDFGIVMARFNTQLPFQFTLRNSRVSSNSQAGIGTYSLGPIDFGSLASPGNNVFQGNGLGQSDGANVVFGGSGSGGPLLAVGNTWDADVQGADASGRYTVSGAGARRDVVDGDGPNYRLRANASGSLRLAENP